VSVATDRLIIIGYLVFIFMLLVGALYVYLGQPFSGESPVSYNTTAAGGLVGLATFFAGAVTNEMGRK
jgi:cytochrome bd-type quinol oxidase subunit 1